MERALADTRASKRARAAAAAAASAAAEAETLGEQAADVLACNLLRTVRAGGPQRDDVYAFAWASKACMARHVETAPLVAGHLEALVELRAGPDVVALVLPLFPRLDLRRLDALSSFPYDAPPATLQGPFPYPPHTEEGDEFAVASAAAATGDGRALFETGLLLRDGTGGAPLSPERAARHFALAALQGHVEALTDLGFRFNKGVGVVADEASDRVVERQCYELAGSKGSGLALANLGFLHESGEGVPQSDDAEAVRYFERSAAVNHADGLEALAFMLAEGRGVAQNWPRCLELRLRAASLGSKLAMNNLGAMFEHGDFVEADLEAAADWYHHAVDAGNEEAAARLARVNALLAAQQ